MSSTSPHIPPTRGVQPLPFLRRMASGWMAAAHVPLQPPQPPPQQQHRSVVVNAGAATRSAAAPAAAPDDQLLNAQAAEIARLTAENDALVYRQTELKQQVDDAL